MAKTKIEWSDYSWSPITGCTKISPGCKNCYAERMARRLAGRYGYPEAPHQFDVTLHPDRLEQPLRWRKPRMIFIPSMGDLFHKNVPLEFMGKVFATMIAADWHTFHVLTKRSARMQNFISWFQAKTSLNLRSFRHIQLGISVESPGYLWRIDELMKCPAAVRFVSCEPLLGAVDLLPWLRPYPNCGNVAEDGTCANLLNPTPECNLASCPMIDVHQGISWCIVGGESGPRARPMHPDWARSIRDQCQATGIPFFFKSWGAWVPIEETDEKLREWADKPLSSRFCWLHEEYGQPAMGGPYADPGWQMFERVGKKAAGRLLDGRLWEEYPRRS